jgi:hypothetical protein
MNHPERVLMVLSDIPEGKVVRDDMENNEHLAYIELDKLESKKEELQGSTTIETHNTSDLHL